MIVEEMGRKISFRKVRAKVRMKSRRSSFKVPYFLAGRG